MKNRKNGLIAKILIVYFLVAIVFRFVGGEQLDFKYVVSEMPKPTGVVEELVEGKTITQTFAVETETLDTVDIKFTTYGRENSGIIMLKLFDENGNLIAEHQDDVDLLTEEEAYKWVIRPGISDAKGNNYSLQITSNCITGSAPAVYFSATESGEYEVDGETRVGAVCVDYVGKTFFLFGAYYWLFVIAGAAVILGYALWSQMRERKGKLTFGLLLTGIWKRYGFLIHQLVERDFKTKYKRSVLGYLWSFLNPLLTMAVQYIVFSTIFKSNIDNFPVYLLSGIIMFNFFTDAVGQGLNAIVENASLITKVYVPKYIYPVTKVVSCSVNLIISVIPLLIVTLLTGAKITKAIILLPYALICILVFCIGLSLFLCTTMVFFRDTKYLWGIVSLVWMYATPIFYPADIIPTQFHFIQALNPMYHYIQFIRTILIQGTSPEPKAYLICAAMSLLTCVVGAFVFKKNQDRFVLYV